MPTKTLKPNIIIFTDLFPRYRGDVKGIFVYDRWEHFAKLNSDLIIRVLALTEYKFKNYPQPRHTFFLNRIWILPRKNKFVTPLVLLHSFSKVIIQFLLLQFHKNLNILIVEYGSPKSILCAILSKILKFRFGIVLRGSDVNIGIQGNTLPKKLLQWSYKTADFLLPVSQEMKNILILKGFSKKKIIVVHGSVAPVWRDFAPNLLKPKVKKGHILVMASSFANGKRQDLLIDAFKEIKKEIIDIELWLIGVGSNLSKCQKQAQNVSGIKFFGTIKDTKEFINLLTNATLLVHLSDHEGLPTIIMEGMSLGLPIIASNVGGIPELLKNNNGIIVPNVKKAVVDACILLLKNERLRIEYSENAYRNSIYYTPERETALLRKVILKNITTNKF